MKLNEKTSLGNTSYAFNKLPFYEEDEKGLVLCDDFIIDEFDEEFLNDNEMMGSESRGRQTTNSGRRIDEGSVNPLTIDEIKQMKTSSSISTAGR